jgi:plasmid stabilization system protein ParE
MSPPVIFRPIAALELDEAMGWYERQKAGLGLEFKEAVDQMLARVTATPERFQPVHGEVRRALLRRFPYAIHFLPEPDAIIVLAVFHTRRDPRHLEGRT